jgi:hypothetical protein
MCLEQKNPMFEIMSFKEFVFLSCANGTYSEIMEYSLNKGYGKTVALLLFPSLPGQGLTLITPESIGPYPALN